MNDRSAIIVIFGITGDLARRKLLPALYKLERENLLSPHTQIIGVTRQKISESEVLKSLDSFVSTSPRPSETALRKFKQSFKLFNADLAELDDYKELKKHLDRIEADSDRELQRIYYLSIPPSVFDEVVELMGKAGLNKSFKEGPKPALLVEKPFGYDLESAKALIKSARLHFNESQIYRIDHYLAKEMAQNILDFRAYNPLFKAVWNKNHINKVVITAFEKIGIEGRVSFYEQIGALRDLVQSHLLQLLALTTMDVPKNQSADMLRSRRRELLEAIKPIDPRQVIKIARRGQYESYRKEVGNDDSNVETYAELTLEIDLPQWKGVPFTLRTGKAVGSKQTEIEVYFGENILSLQLQPEEAINLQLLGKKPGHGHQTSKSVMDFNYKRSYPGTSSPEAYERVLMDAINQDQALFASSDEVLAAWRVIQPVLDEWSKTDSDLVFYQSGSEPFTQ